MNKHEQREPINEAIVADLRSGYPFAPDTFDFLDSLQLADYVVTSLPRAMSGKRGVKKEQSDEATGPVYGWSLDGETWHGGECFDRDTALRDARVDSAGEIWPIYTCACKRFSMADLFTDRLAGLVCDVVRECLNEEAWELVGEVAEIWQFRDEEPLKKAIRKAVFEHVPAPNFWQAVDIEKHSTKEAQR